MERLDRHQTASLVEAINTWRYNTDSRQHGFFLVKRDAGAWRIGSLGDFEHSFFDKDVDEEDRFVGFVDPSDYPDNPGWPLRNLLMLVRKRWGWRKVRVLCYRDTHQTHQSRLEPKSLVMECELEAEEGLGELDLSGKIIAPTTGYGLTKCR